MMKADATIAPVDHARCAIFAVKIALPLLVAVSTFKRQEWVARVAERSKN
jgi:hypothetical protein